MSSLNVVSEETLLRSPARVDLSLVSPEGAVVQPKSRFPISLHKRLELDLLNVADRSDPIAIQFLLELCANPADHTHAARSEVVRRLFDREGEEPARLVRLACRFGQELVAGQSNRDFPAQWDPKLGIHVT